MIIKNTIKTWTYDNQWKQEENVIKNAQVNYKYLWKYIRISNYSIHKCDW